MAVYTAWKDSIEVGRCGVCGAKSMENYETLRVVFNSPQTKATTGVLCEGSKEFHGFEAIRDFIDCELYGIFGFEFVVERECCWGKIHQVMSPECPPATIS